MGHDASNFKTVKSTVPPIGGPPTVKQFAAIAGISQRSAERFRFVRRYGINEIAGPLKDGTLSLGQAERIAKLPHDRQLAEIQAAVNAPPRSRKRNPRTINSDLDQIGELVNRLFRRWSPTDMMIVAVAFDEMAEQILAKAQAAKKMGGHE